MKYVLAREGREEKKIRLNSSFSQHLKATASFRTFKAPAIRVRDPHESRSATNWPAPVSEISFHNFFGKKKLMISKEVATFSYSSKATRVEEGPTGVNNKTFFCFLHLFSLVLCANLSRVFFILVEIPLIRLNFRPSLEWGVWRGSAGTFLEQRHVTEPNFWGSVFSHETRQRLWGETNRPKREWDSFTPLQKGPAGSSPFSYRHGQSYLTVKLPRQVQSRHKLMFLFLIRQ